MKSSTLYGLSETLFMQAHCRSMTAPQILPSPELSNPCDGLKPYFSEVRGQPAGNNNKYFVINALAGYETTFVGPRQAQPMAFMTRSFAAMKSLWETWIRSDSRRITCSS